MTKDLIKKLKQYHNNKDYKGLIKESQQMLEKNADSFVLNDIIASTYGILEEYDVAIEYYEKALKLKPDSYAVCCSLGISYLKINDFYQASKYFNRAIDIDPSQYEAYVRLALLFSEQKDYKNAIEYLEKSISIDPNSSQLYYLGGTIFAAMKSYDDAFMFFNQCLSLNQDHVDCLRTISQLYMQTEDYKKALIYLQRLLKLDSNNSDYLNNLGVCFLRMKKLDESEKIFQNILENNPDHLDSLINMAHLYTLKRDLDKSKELLEKALQIDPTSKLAKIHLASLSLHEGNVDAALSDLSKLEKENIEEVSVFINLGNAHLGTGQFVKAMHYYKKALDLEPRRPDTLLNVGNAFRELRKYTHAISSYKLCLKYKPEYLAAYNNLGVLYSETRDFEKAIENFNSVLEKEPDYHTSLSQKLYAQAQICDWSTFQKDQQYFRKITTSDHIIPPFCLLYLDDDPKGQLVRAKNYVEKKYNYHKTFETKNIPKIKPKKIKLAYFSCDFYNHATMHLISKLFKLHDKEKFEIHAYSYDLTNSVDQVKKDLIDSVDYYHDVKFMSDAEVALHARKNEIDIGIDLKGYTLQTRVGIFGYRFAPIQISYLGYPGTTAAPFIDYIIADKQVIPNQLREFYTENIIYMPDSYQVNNDERKISENVFSRSDFNLPNDSFVYCCFNQPYKITPLEFDIWMNILRSVPNSVLWMLKYNDVAMKNLKAYAHEKGIDPSRLIFSDRMENEMHLKRHCLADLFLDTFNVNAHTTTSDSLWGGLPVLTLAGKSFAARVSASLLNAIGLNDLITTNKNDYEKLAIKIGKSKDLCEGFKQKLKNNKKTFPLFNSLKFTKNLEDAYLKVFDNYLEGIKPKDFEIKKAFNIN